MALVLGAEEFQHGEAVADDRAVGGAQDRADLVRRAAREASSIDGLWQALSMHIELPAERAAFLRQRHA